MGTHQVELRDVHSGPPPSRKRLLAPLRYLAIKHPEKTAYDVIVPAAWAAFLFVGYVIVEPKPPLFGDAGLIKLVRDLLIMAVPFLVGALAAVAMGSPGPHLDRRLLGAPLYLDGEALTLRQFVCHLLGYLCFLGLMVLIATVGATILHDAVVAWTKASPNVQLGVRFLGAFGLCAALSVLTVTVLWGLYFLTTVVNKK
jgi:hypothetical protein